MRERLQRIDLARIDAALGGLLALDLVLEAILADGVPHDRRVVTAVFAIPFAAAIGFRRRATGAALVACMSLAAIQQALHGQLFTTLPSESAEFAPILCAYGVGAWLDWRAGAVPLAIGTMLALATGVIASAQHVAGSGGLSGAIGIAALFTLGPWVLGCFIRERARRLAAFDALEVQARAERAQRERAAIAHERIAIGRELHDIIAHNVSVMVIQAAGARRALSREPQLARESILNVEHSGREALAEMRRLLGLLRKDDDPRALTPQPGLEQLDELVAELAAAGLRCELIVEGEPVALTPGIDLVGYRVLATALTAARGHGSRHAVVRVRYMTRALELQIVSDASPARFASALTAIAERVGLYGGQLDVNAGRGGVVTVTCTLPLERTRAVA
jgi:signal transduction histidine kinase